MASLEGWGSTIELHPRDCGGEAPLAPTSPADQDLRVAVRVERSAWPIRRAAQARRGWSEEARRVPKAGLCGADPCTDELPAAGQLQVRNRRSRRIRVSTSSVYDSAAHGLTGDGVTNDQPASPGWSTGSFTSTPRPAGRG